MADRVIHLKRNKPFVHEQLNSEEVQETLSYSKQSVGSYFAGKATTKKGTGLSDNEIKLFMPRILSVNPEEVEFRKRVNDFYVEISTDVPYKGGVTLNIGLQDGSEEKLEDLLKGISKVTKDNMPENLDDYIKFRHALYHPDVAPSPEAARGNQLARFYFEDPKQVIAEEIKNLDIADKALSTYQQVKEDAGKVEMLVTLLKSWIPKKPGKPVPILHTLTPDQKRILLRDIALSHPAKFDETANDELLTKKFIVDELISVGLLKRVGSTIINVETGDGLGESLKDVAIYLSLPANSGLFQSLKAEYKSIRKKSLGEDKDNSSRAD